MTAWKCIGIPPRTPSCGAAGESDRDAEKHTRQTGHGTTSGHTTRGVEVIARALSDDRSSS